MKICRRSSTSRQPNRGATLLLLALLLSVLLGMIALAIGLGFVALDRLRLRNLSNLVALSAIEAYSRGGSADRTYEARVSDGLANAERVASSNRLYGMAESLGDLVRPEEASSSPDHGGVVEFGQWIHEARDCPENRENCCSASYPCFVSNSPGDDRATAVRVRLRTQPSNPILAPFTRMLGSGYFSMTSESTATVLQRCTAFILDVSGSSSSDSHTSTVYYQTTNRAGETPNYEITYPQDAALTAYRYTNANPTTNCSSLGGPGDFEAVHWCNMGLSRNAPGPTLKRHYRSDYRFFNTLAGPVMIDRYREPEPLQTFMRGFNAALRTLHNEASSGDRGLIIVFGRDARDRVPSTGVTQDLQYLIQLTNMENAGRVDTLGNWTTPPRSPNWVERGWFPLYQTGGTNLNYALHLAIEELSTQCPPHSKKSIILATDGIMTLDHDRNPGNDSFREIGSYGDPNDPTEQPNTYVSAERRLLDTTSIPRRPHQSGILGDLIRLKIGVTVLLAGAHVQPNQLNYWTEDPAPYFPDGHFLSLFEAITHGFTGITGTQSDPPAPGGPFFNNRSSVPDMSVLQQLVEDAACYSSSESSRNDACAWELAGIVPNVYFRRANGIMAELVFRTGGIMCPVLPLANDEDYYNHDGRPHTPEVLRNERRQHGTYQYTSVEKIDPGTLAARCSRDTIGLNPFVLVEEE